MSRKLKVYLDTSFISHLMQEDVPEKNGRYKKIMENVQEWCIWGMSFYCHIA